MSDTVATSHTFQDAAIKATQLSGAATVPPHHLVGHLRIQLHQGDVLAVAARRCCRVVARALTASHTDA
jgi:hypothetical protein